MHLYLHSQCELSMCFNFVIMRNAISCQLCHNVWCVAFIDTGHCKVLIKIDKTDYLNFAIMEQRFSQISC